MLCAEGSCVDAMLELPGRELRNFLTSRRGYFLVMALA
jgi:hypothetical protein